MKRNVPRGQLGADPAHAAVDTMKVPYRHPQPAGMVPDLVLPGLLQLAQDPNAGDPREWVPLTDTVFFKPICSTSRTAITRTCCG